MVTKGYRRGVYVRVTEGTWESSLEGNCAGTAVWEAVSGAEMLGVTGKVAFLDGLRNRGR